MKRALAFVLVLVQMLLLAGLILVPRGSVWPVNGFVIATALVLGVAGVALAVQGARGLGPAMTASPIPRDQTPLATHGVYGLVRNPIYSGLLLGGLGLVLYGATLLHVVIWLMLMGLLSGKARWEERMLMLAHPHYPEYAARVGRFLPGVGRLR